MKLVANMPGRIVLLSGVREKNVWLSLGHVYPPQEMTWSSFISFLLHCTLLIINSVSVSTQEGRLLDFASS